MLGANLLSNLLAFTDLRVTLVSLVVSLFVLVIYQSNIKAARLWRKLGVEGEKPFGFLTELTNVFLKNRIKLAVERTRKYGKIYGIFFGGKPRLVVADAEVLRQITIKDFDNFQNHMVNEWANKYQRLFLAFLQGDHWRRVRALMSPQFTSNKMRRMYRLMDGCAEDLLECFREQMIDARRNEGPDACARVDLFATYSLYTMDGITTCCYGLKLQRERGDTDIGRASARNALVRDCNRVFKFDFFRFALLLSVPKFLLRTLKFYISAESKLIPLTTRVERLIEMRRKEGAATNRYDDLLQMLIEAKPDDQLVLDELDQAENHHAGLTRESLLADQEQMRTKSMASKRGGATMSDLEIISEALFLLAAGLDTTRSSLSTISYLLAHHPEIQDRLVAELRKIARYEETPVGRHLSFDYGELTSCAYLDAVISESLRIFAPVLYTDRVCQNDYKIEKYDVLVPKGSNLLLNLHSVANDPDYWKQPERFDPDRFMPGQREHIVPGSYAPFGMGPRHCVGMRFSLTETKLGLAKVLLNYRLLPAPGTRYPPEPTRGISLMHVKTCEVLVDYRDEQ